MPEPSRRLIFHIGHHKTGTTAIQDALATGLIEVDGRAPLYPTALNHNYLTRHVKTYGETGALLPADRQMPNLEQIGKALAKGDHRHAVISGESFSGVAPAVTAKAMQDFFLPHVEDHAVICYVRPHAARTLSGFVEQSKVGYFDGPSVAAFHRAGPAAGRFRFTPGLRACAESFGPQFVARPFHREFLVNGSVIDDFAAHAFPEGRIRIHEQQSSNESSSLEDLVLLRMVQAQLRDRPSGLRLQLGWALALAMDSEEPGERDAMMRVIHGLIALARSLRGGARTKVALDRQTAEEIRETYVKDARVLDRTVFAATPLMLRELDRAVDAAVESPQSFEPSDHYSPEALRQIGEAIAELGALLGPEGKGWTRYFLRRRMETVERRREARLKAAR